MKFMILYKPKTGFNNKMEDTTFLFGSLVAVVGMKMLYEAIC